MIQVWDNLKVYFILFITIISFEYCYRIGKSIDTSTLSNFLGKESWQLNNNNNYNLDNQQIFINGELKKITDSFLSYPSNLTKKNAAEVASLMYLALGYKCGETIIDMLLE